MEGFRKKLGFVGWETRWKGGAGTWCPGVPGGRVVGLPVDPGMFTLEFSIYAVEMFYCCKHFGSKKKVAEI